MGRTQKVRMFKRVPRNPIKYCTLNIELRFHMIEIRNYNNNKAKVYTAVKPKPTYCSAI